MRKNLDSNKDKYNNIIDNKTGDYIKTLGINYENITLPNFIIFITDIDYNILKNEEIQKKLLNLFIEEININNIIYKLHNIIFMPSQNHYTLAKINAGEILLVKNIDINNFYYYDDLSGVITEKSKSDLNDFIKSHIGYIYIYSKV